MESKSRRPARPATPEDDPRRHYQTQLAYWRKDIRLARAARQDARRQNARRQNAGREGASTPRTPTRSNQLELIACRLRNAKVERAHYHRALLRWDKKTELAGFRRRWAAVKERIDRGEVRREEIKEWAAKLRRLQAPEAVEVVTEDESSGQEEEAERGPEAGEK